MDSDRDLLKLAAKAAGLGEVWSLPDHDATYVGKRWELSNPVEYKVWNPLTDDGDALRLAVKLQIDVAHTDIHSPQVHALASYKVQIWEDSSTDPYAATRRAIVRAAAEIGRAMK